MSAFAMVQRESDTGPVFESARADGGKPVQDAIASIVTYIPTEIITIYTALVAWQAEKQGADRPLELRYFLVPWIASPLLVLFIWKFITGRNKTGLQFPGWAVAASIISFPFWAATLQPTPLSAWSDYDATFTGVVLIVASIVIGLGAQAFGPQP